MQDYNTPIRFDGDIIITDPCYFIRKDENKQLIHEIEFEHIEKPRYEEYFSCMSEPNKMPSDKDYADCIMLSISDPRVTRKDMDSAIIQLELEEIFASCASKAFSMEKARKKHSIPYSEKFRKEKEMYLEAFYHYKDVHPNDDWSYCEYGNTMEKLGFTIFLCNSTQYGDWSCTIFDTKNEKAIGKFCADSGMVGVFLLNEVLKYNPTFDDHLNHTFSTTWIKDFHGTIELNMQNPVDNIPKVSVIGKGNVNFKSIQTGW